MEYPKKIWEKAKKGKATGRLFQVGLLMGNSCNAVWEKQAG